MQNYNLRLVGHPFAPIGMGEHLRSTFRSLQAAHLAPSITDIYKLNTPTDEEKKELFSHCSDKPAPVNIYCINGNEVEQALKHLSYQESWSGYNIIYPAWELSNYPDTWAKQLDKFDEVWASSNFTYEALSGACEKEVIKLPLACGISLTSFLGRRYFHIPESSYVFLFFFDLKSYASRKNPYAVINAFKELLTLRPYSMAHLVIKINGTESNPVEYKKITNLLSTLGDNTTCINQTMTANEVKNLMRCCDCFISLHRSEGYGFGIAEAMTLGKPVIATAYSGNLEFMDITVSYGVGYELIPLADDDYPFAEGQVWAEADWHEAAQHMLQLVDSPQAGREKGKQAQAHMEKNFSPRAIGLNYLNRLNYIQNKISN